MSRRTAAPRAVGVGADPEVPQDCIADPGPVGADSGRSSSSSLSYRDALFRAAAGLFAPRISIPPPVVPARSEAQLQHGARLGVAEGQLDDQRLPQADQEPHPAVPPDRVYRQRDPPRPRSRRWPTRRTAAPFSSAAAEITPTPDSTYVPSIDATISELGGVLLLDLHLSYPDRGRGGGGLLRLDLHLSDPDRDRGGGHLLNLVRGLLDFHLSDPNFPSPPFRSPADCASSPLPGGLLLLPLPCSTGRGRWSRRM